MKALGEANGISAAQATGITAARQAEAGQSLPPYKQGERPLSVTATDATGKVTEWETTTKADATKPEIELKGQFAYATEEEGTEGEENEASENKLNQPVYNLHINAIDGSRKEKITKQSGVKSIKVYLDETLVDEEKASSCPASSCELKDDYPVGLTGLDERRVHKLKVVATDYVELARERVVEFEYVPATGISDEYVMQHFPLSDGSEEEGEEGEENGHGPELAVNLMNGNLVYHERDTEVNTPSTDLEVERFYNSQLPKRLKRMGQGLDALRNPRSSRPKKAVPKKVVGR